MVANILVSVLTGLYVNYKEIGYSGRDDKYLKFLDHVPHILFITLLAIHGYIVFIYIYIQWLKYPIRQNENREKFEIRMKKKARDHYLDYLITEKNIFKKIRNYLKMKLFYSIYTGNKK